MVPSSSANSKESSSASTTTPRMRRPGVLTEIVDADRAPEVLRPPERSLQTRAAHLERIGPGKRAGDLVAVEDGRDGLGRGADRVEIDPTLTVDEHPDNECPTGSGDLHVVELEAERGHDGLHGVHNDRARRACAHLLTYFVVLDQAKKKRGLTPTSPQTGGSPPTIELRQYTQGIG